MGQAPARNVTMYSNDSKLVSRGSKHGNVASLPPMAQEALRSLASGHLVSTMGTSMPRDTENSEDTPVYPLSPVQKETLRSSATDKGQATASRSKGTASDEGKRMGRHSVPAMGASLGSTTAAS